VGWWVQFHKGPLIVLENPDSTGDDQGLRGLHQVRSWLLQLHLGQDTWGQENHPCQPSPSYRPMCELGVTHHGRLSPDTGEDTTVSSSRPQSCLPRSLSLVWGKSCELPQLEENLSWSLNNNLDMVSPLIIYGKDLRYLCTMSILLNSSDVCVSIYRPHVPILFLEASQLMSLHFWNDFSVSLVLSALSLSKEFS
jgi:hypothetical protein